MNYQAISTLIGTQGYKLDYIGTSYSRSLNPVINVGLVKDEESIAFNLKYSCIEDFAKGIKELSNFISWLAQNDEKRGVKELSNFISWLAQNDKKEEGQA